MYSSFSIALSALSADSSAIDVVGNNLANLNTAGFKGAEVEFSDLMSQSLGVGSFESHVGLGVGPVQAVTEFTQGTLTATNSPTDAAIQGNGFFIVKDQDNQTLYTRDGSFQVDSGGNLVTATGQFVQGWSAVNGSVNPNGPTGNLTLPLGSIVPGAATTSMTVNMNLNSQVATTDPGATFSAPVQVYDSQGTSHTLTLTFTKTGANSWNYAVTIPAADLKSGSASIATGALSFDANGNLTSPAASGSPIALSIKGLADGASDMSVNWNLYDNSGNPVITQLADASAISGTTQDGKAAGQIVNVGLENGGLVVAKYSNGKQVTVGQLALASISNPQSLLSVGDNNLQATASTSAALVGAANTAGLGQIVAGSLESSTVDIASQFTNLLSYERSYQAASRVITTSDQLLQETMNLIHP
jgi:flagellar hook protein FlgE